LRVYIERYEADAKHHNIETQIALADLVTLSRNISNIAALTGRSQPDVIT
jgi:phosphoglucomutase